MAKFRLLDLTHDRSLAFGLIAAAAVVFQQPLRFLLTVAGDVESQYNLDLLPALVVLCAVLMLHLVRKRHESAAAAAEAEMAAQLERARVAELDELVMVGRSLANALQFAEIEQALWRNLPAMLRDCQLSVVIREGRGWRALVRDVDGVVGGHAAAEDVVSAATAQFQPYSSGSPKPVASEGFLCFPIFANREVVGAAVIIDGPTTRSDRLQLSLAPVLAFVGIAIRNIQLLTESRDDSVRDSLTRWFNRRHAVEVLQNEIRRAVRSNRFPSVLMFDLDGFKRANDLGGHLHGDAVLQAVTSLVGGLLRNSDVKCRYGGDEFLVILPETTLEGATQVAEHVRRAVASTDLVPSATAMPRVTCSIGVSIARQGELDPERLIARADAALYRAKRAGRNQVVVHDGTAERENAAPRLVATGS